MPVRITLDKPLDEKAAEAARREGISLEELVQRAVAEHLERQKAEAESQPKRIIAEDSTHLEEPAIDPFFSDTAIISDSGPADAARNHDRYLYETNPSSHPQGNGDRP